MVSAMTVPHVALAEVTRTSALDSARDGPYPAKSAPTFRFAQTGLRMQRNLLQTIKGERVSGGTSAVGVRSAWGESAC